MDTKSEFVDWQELATRRVLGTLLDFEDPTASQRPFRFCRALPAAAARTDQFLDVKPGGRP